MIVLAHLAAMEPEMAKTIGIVMVMVTAFLSAVLYPIARAYARRLEGSGSAASAALREDLADISAQLEQLRQGQERMAELEERVDFAERMLAQRGGTEPARLEPGGQP